MKINKSNKSVMVGASLLCIALMNNGCNMKSNIPVEKYTTQISNNTYETEYSTNEITNNTVEITSNISETEIIESSGFIPDETIALENTSRYLTQDEFRELCAIHLFTNGEFFYLDLSLDCPMVLENLRNYYGNQDLEIDDLHYLMNRNNIYITEENSFSDIYGWIFEGLNTSFFSEFMRCKLSENNLRFLIDSFPYSYYEENCPNILNDFCNNPSKYCSEGERYFEIIANMESLDDIPYEVGTEDYNMFVEFLNFFVAFSNNGLFYSGGECLEGNINEDPFGYIKIGRNTDGNLVWLPTEEDIEVVQNIVDEYGNMPGYTLGTVESYDDLRALGIDVDTYIEFQNNNSVVNTQSTSKIC